MAERQRHRGKFTQNYPTERKNYPGPEHGTEGEQEPVEALIDRTRRKILSEEHRHGKLSIDEAIRIESEDLPPENPDKKAA